MFGSGASWNYWNAKDGHVCCEGSVFITLSRRLCCVVLWNGAAKGDWCLQRLRRRQYASDENWVVMYKFHRDHEYNSSCKFWLNRFCNARKRNLKTQRYQVIDFLYIRCIHIYIPYSISAFFSSQCWLFRITMHKWDGNIAVSTKTLHNFACTQTVALCLHAGV